MIVSAATGCQATPATHADNAASTTTTTPATRGAVATVNRIATEAGLAQLRAGGNAIDAAVAAALTLGVVDGHNSGIGGGCFVLIRTADGRVLAIDGREMAPGKATRDMYLEDGKPVPGLSLIGPLAVGIPGSLMAYEQALHVAGTRSLASILAPAADLAANGFAIDEEYVKCIEKEAATIAGHAGIRALLLDEAGKPWPVGHVLKQDDLAATYRAIARDGIGHFYGGAFAKAVGEWMAANGGIITANDFANYRVGNREAVHSTYTTRTVGEIEIHGFPPPSSGGVHVAQILNILDARPDWKTADATLRTHLLIEAMRLAFADRAQWLGDPDFSDVPRGLVSKEYAAQLAASIDPAKANPGVAHGTPPGADKDVFRGHTTHIAAADALGNMVAITTTVNTTFGSKVVVPGTGVILNNQMDDFSSQPGVPNVFGLVGAEANSIAPGKRPLSSMSPTIVLAHGKPLMTLGGAGGPRIITAVLQTLLRHLDDGLPLEQAINAPRVHQQWKPAEVFAEPEFDAATRSWLTAHGHVVKDRPRDGMGVVQAIRFNDDGTFVTVSDPRVPGDRTGRGGTIHGGE
ncbi:MAG: gamma-glutamyltransferase [Planctomycetota bacterium]